MDNAFSENQQQQHQVLTSHEIQAMTEFTQHINWPLNILQELRDIVHVLSPKLCILVCSQASIELLGYQPSELVGHLFTEFIHDGEAEVFVREYYAAMSAMKSLRICYRMLRKDGKYIIMETKGHFKQNRFFGSARCVPTRPARILDTFLDYKMENEILKRKIAFLRLNIRDTDAEISEITEGSDGSKASRNYSLQNHVKESDSDEDSNRDNSGSDVDYDCHNDINYDDHCDNNYSNDYNIADIDNGEDEDLKRHKADEKKDNGFVQTCPTSGDIVQILPNSFNVPGNVVPIYDASSCQERKYSDDNLLMELRNKVLNAPNFIKLGKNDLAIENNQVYPQRAEKRRFTDTIEQKICVGCSTTNAPEWRKGPKGPKTLCNACGLRWAKASRKKS
ncbi:GATA-type zinc finger transcription factor [Phycomyces blakesleeanus]|uniref:GATA-type zinc finger transcription factor n=2 Tax=Phycomyces blakesleeanus TaxID=4837 RepID=A0A167PWP7_PHYB8|nr:GATA-type zinc finger transcription factor [Phycomyces blakesleeanus NRRL 1555(-)]OAD78674.1 GATA-type zinc finger transcription factor [Phycomyces blakesleeanus NRRL 1555(-)]CAQ76859.1 wctB [Phycomyces blakesleeanus]|eukprot:XP_018296714.1 GATA-type zinc finger transcription factor [Phycomyces blakesleeanus NRRL 1555(-)]